MMRRCALMIVPSVLSCGARSIARLVICLSIIARRWCCVMSRGCRLRRRRLCWGCVRRRLRVGCIARVVRCDSRLLIMVRGG